MRRKRSPRYPREQHRLRPRDRTVAESAQWVVSVVESEDGMATFFAFGRAGKRRIIDIIERLPETHSGELIEYSKDNPLETAKHRFSKYEVRLLVRRADRNQHADRHDTE